VSIVVLSASGVANFSEGGGHFWVYMQYAHSLRQLGCDVFWVERFHHGRDQHATDEQAATFFDRMARFGLAGKAILYSVPASSAGAAPCAYLGMSEHEAAAVFHRADLLLNFDYHMPAALLAQFRRTALVDIDPGLLQFWIDTDQISLPAHDVYLTTGENVRTIVKPGAPTRAWTYVRRPVCLDLWPFTYDSASEAFTTVSSWWGGYGAGEWVTDGKGLMFENNKRVSFLQMADLPGLVSRPLELALFLGEGDPLDPPVLKSDWQAERDSPSDITDYQSDAVDCRFLEARGWRIRHSRDVAGTPWAFQQYVQQSRGEFSCAKPSCMRFQNAWISDRTLCYLASGKPAIVQHSGPSAYLPDGEGLFRFTTIAEAADALRTVDAAYDAHCRAAREIAVAYFDGPRVLAEMLNAALERNRPPLQYLSAALGHS
jgi:hypothetical protein